MDQRSNQAPGFRKHPGYKIDIARHPKRITVTFKGEIVADSREALEINETGIPPVYYIPREDVLMDLFERTETETYCPFKGQATYWTLTIGDAVSTDAAWSYETPYDECQNLGGHLSFYGDRVDEVNTGLDP